MDRNCKTCGYIKTLSVFEPRCKYSACGVSRIYPRCEYQYDRCKGDNWKPNLIARIKMFSSGGRQNDNE